MRVNVYAEEMTDRIEIISKEIDGQKFTGLRLYLELPVSFKPNGESADARHDMQNGDLVHVAGAFIHRPGDDDSSAVTFWGKRDLRDMLRMMLAELDKHYGDTSERDDTKRRAETYRTALEKIAEIARSWRDQEILEVAEDALAEDMQEG
jgi:hypothetical protein